MSKITHPSIQDRGPSTTRSLTRTMHPVHARRRRGGDIIHRVNEALAWRSINLDEVIDVDALGRRAALRLDATHESYQLVDAVLGRVGGLRACGDGGEVRGVFNTRTPATFEPGDAAEIRCDTTRYAEIQAAPRSRRDDAEIAPRSRRDCADLPELHPLTAEMSQHHTPREVLTRGTPRQLAWSVSSLSKCK